ncbi:unnamed protein product [Mytilus edulis]|uniref:BEN domain-containing protein n=1 Tax=Mytilus edulis TaxID=6550 RepID=A0A8S3S9G1_MYTED|nr:unnamed protein product [Mytilus edulis]
MPGLLAVASDDDTDEENTIPEEMVIPGDGLTILKDRAHSAGNFASILLKELMPQLFGQENLRNMYNWNGGGINAKREVCPRAKLAIRQYVNHYYPECRKEETFRNVVVHKVNEALRRPRVKACRRCLLTLQMQTNKCGDENSVTSSLICQSHATLCHGLHVYGSIKKNVNRVETNNRLKSIKRESNEEGNRATKNQAEGKKLDKDVASREMMMTRPKTKKQAEGTKLENVVSIFAFPNGL